MNIFMSLPNRIFFTGVPGSKWSSIAQTIESIPGFNTSDRCQTREYTHHAYSGHKGAYFGKGMEFTASLDPTLLDKPWSNHSGCKLTKSHEWAHVLPEIKLLFPSDWIMLVYRPDLDSMKWWLDAGGFNISYPSYSYYKTEDTMLKEITSQNTKILSFAANANCTWHQFTPSWVQETFGVTIAVPQLSPNILVTIVK